jgi:hypothetical protein
MSTKDKHERTKSEIFGQHDMNTKWRERDRVFIRIGKVTGERESL